MVPGIVAFGGELSLAFRIRSISAKTGIMTGDGVSANGARQSRAGDASSSASFSGVAARVSAVTLLNDN